MPVSCGVHAVQVSSRFVQCSSGLEIVGKARQLASHFDTVGTPIMMGGGSLAYTLLGVDYNSSSGDARFLILVRRAGRVSALYAAPVPSLTLEPRPLAGTCAGSSLLRR